MCMEVKKPPEEGLRRRKCHAKDGTVLNSADQVVLSVGRTAAFDSDCPKTGRGVKPRARKDVTRKMAPEPTVKSDLR